MSVKQKQELQIKLIIVRVVKCLLTKNSSGDVSLTTGKLMDRECGTDNITVEHPKHTQNNLFCFLLLVFTGHGVLPDSVSHNYKHI